VHLRIILNFIPSYELQTRGEDAEQFEGCSLCILYLNCNTKFTSGHFTHYSRLQPCQDDASTKTEIQFAINLPLFRSYFDVSEMIKEHTHLLNSPPLVTLPNLTFYLSQISEELGVLSSNRILLDKAVQFLP